MKLDFVCIGAPRAGTTSLHEVLLRNGLGLPRWEKETHFFDRYFDRGLGWYNRKLAEPLSEGLPRGEVAPSYLRDPAVPERLQQCFPAVKIFVVLRHPVWRAVSHHRFLRYHFGVTRSLSESLRLPGREPLDSSRYGTHLRRFAQLFGREQVHLIIFEEMVRAPALELAGLADFLALPPLLAASEGLPRLNETRVPRSSLLWEAGRRIRNELYARDLGGVVQRARRSGLTRLMTKPISVPPVESDAGQDVISELFAVLRPEVRLLSELFSFEFESAWDMTSGPCTVTGVQQCDG